jgi:hypothetical protein
MDGVVKIESDAELKVVVGAGIEPAALPMSRGYSTAELTDHRARITRKNTFKYSTTPAVYHDTR